MRENLVIAIAIGLAVGGFLYAGVVRRIDDRSVRKALAVASLAFGGAIALWLRSREDVLDQVMAALTERGVLVLVAATGAAILYWRFRAARH